MLRHWKGLLATLALTFGASLVTHNFARLGADWPTEIGAPAGDSVQLRTWPRRIPHSTARGWEDTTATWTPSPAAIKQGPGPVQTHGQGPLSTVAAPAAPERQAKKTTSIYLDEASGALDNSCAYPLLEPEDCTISGFWKQPSLQCTSRQPPLAHQVSRHVKCGS